MNLHDSKSRVSLMSTLPCARQLLQGLSMAPLLHSHLPTLLGARGKDLKHIQPMLLKVVQGQLILTREVQPLQHSRAHFYFQPDKLTLRSHFKNC